MDLKYVNHKELKETCHEIIENYFGCEYFCASRLLVSKKNDWFHMEKKVFWDWI